MATDPIQNAYDAHRVAVEAMTLMAVNAAKAAGQYDPEGPTVAQQAAVQQHFPITPERVACMIPAMEEMLYLSEIIDRQQPFTLWSELERLAEMMIDHEIMMNWRALG